MLGSESSTALYDEDLSSMNLYGLLQACGTPSSHDSNSALKRSARNAMNLLKFLVCDFADKVNGRPVPLETDPKTGAKELNGFAHALCCCTVPQLLLMRPDLHLAGEGDARGGAKDDCCQVLALALSRHVAEDGETPDPLALEEILRNPAARNAFTGWLTSRADREVFMAVKRARADAKGQKGGSPRGSPGGAPEPKRKTKTRVTFTEDDDDEDDEDILDGFKQKRRGAGAASANAQSQENQFNRYQRKDGRSQAEPEPELGPPTKWADSQLAREQRVDGMLHTGAREKQASATQKKKQEEEKMRLASRDPLNLREADFNLTRVQEHYVDLLERAIKDMEEAMAEDGIPVEPSGSGAKKKRRNVGLDHITSLQAQRDALEKILKGRPDSEIEEDAPAPFDTILDKVEDTGDKNPSILPTDPGFDPLLFLTLVHRNASFEQLQTSIAKLDNKADSQIARLQNMVRENFDLFVRCADGIELFNLESNQKGRTGKEEKDGPGVRERLSKLEALSESSSYQAKKSFKPLLDNTSEVRKVQSALSVLQRIGPLLQIPTSMRQHIENGRYAALVKAYRRALVIEEDNNIEILRHVKLKATEAAREGRENLEKTLADPNVVVTDLLDAIRDLGELIELGVPEGSSKSSEEGTFVVGSGQKIHVREHTPAMACLLLQSAYFVSAVEKLLRQADESTQKIYGGEMVSSDGGERSKATSEDASAGDATASKEGDEKSSHRQGGNRWKYDVLEARVIATKRAVAVAKNWLPRLLRIAVAAREVEKREANRKPKASISRKQEAGREHPSAFGIFVGNITPGVNSLVEHATFCALGCSNNNRAEELKMTFGLNANKKLQSLLRAPLPPAQSTRCASELAEMYEVTESIAESSMTLRPGEGELDDVALSSHRSGIVPLEDSVALSEDSVVTVERRRCIYAFDVSARSCSQRASGAGTFDGDALLSCVQNLSEELSRAEDCASEIEKGCELVVRRCCEGLASYVRDRGDVARLRVVAECAKALNGSVVDIVREVSYLTSGQCESLEEALVEDISALEASMFDEFLDNICRHVARCTKLGTIISDRDVDEGSDKKPKVPQAFPAYLSACLLAIVRCRAQVDRALGDTAIRRSQGITYQYLGMATAADGTVAGICYELNERMSNMTAPQADRFANELQFLMNTLKKYLSGDMLSVAENCKGMLLAKAGHRQGQGPDGLMQMEELERLGRIYALCLYD